MKKSKVLFVAAFLIAVCSAFVTKVQVKMVTSGWNNKAGACFTYALPSYCNGGTSICTVTSNGVTSDMFKDNACVIPYYQY